MTKYTVEEKVLFLLLLVGLAAIAPSLTDTTITGMVTSSISGNTGLTIYDEFEGTFTYNDTEIVFFANYTNSTNDAHISGATCNISFDDGATAIMNEAANQYNYTKTEGFSTAGIHSWNVTCNATGYVSMTLTDGVNVTRDVNHAPTNPQFTFTSDSAENLTSENLVVSITGGDDPDSDPITNITDFRLNGDSVAVLNTPFDINSDSTIKDYSSYSNNLSFASTSADWVSGKVGGAYDFDGTDKRVDVNIDQIKNLRNMTMSFWAYPEAGLSGTFVIAKDNSYRWYFQMGAPSDNDVRIISRFGSSHDQNVYGVLPSLNRWYHVAIRVSEKEGTDIYINGSLVSSKSDAVNTFSDMPTPKSAYLGSVYYNDFLRGYMNGTIDEFKIYDVLLPLEQIQLEYQAGLDGKHMLEIHNETTHVGDNWSVAVTSVDSKNFSQSVLSDNIFITTSQIPIYSNFGGRTTDFENASDLSNISNITLDYPNIGRVEWGPSGRDVRSLNFNQNVQIARDSIFINSSNLASLNHSANITFYNTTFIHSPVIYLDGSYCAGCEIIEYSRPNLTFSVSHFSNYSIKANSELNIYDSIENSSAYNDTEVVFFANYTNSTNDAHISGATCNISFDDGTTAIMNEAANQYNYTKTEGFSTAGIHSWNVTCSADGYETHTVIDDLSIDLGPPQVIFTHNWNTTIGGAGSEKATSVIRALDGGFLVAGDLLSGLGFPYTSIVKLNSTGHHIWNRTYGKEGQADTSNDLVETDSGDILLAGSTESYGAGSKDGWILKLNSTGHHIWNRTLGGAADDNLSSIVETDSGDILLAGSTESYGAGDKDGWVIKLNSTGHQLWNRTYGTIQADIANSITSTSSGGIGITGFWTSLSTYAWTLKLNSTGHHVWNHTFFVSGTTGDDIIESSDEGFIVADDAGQVGSVGQVGSAGQVGSNALYIFKLNSTGQMQWNFSFPADDAAAYSITSAQNGVYTTSGYSTNSTGTDFLFLKFTEEGNLLWNHTLGGSNTDISYSICEYEKGEYVTAGSTQSYGSGSSDMWVLGFSTPSDYSFNHTTPQNKTINMSDTAEYEIIVTNDGDLTDNYTISFQNLNSADVVSLSDSSFEDIYPQKSFSFNLSVSDSYPGDYIIQLDIVSDSNSSINETMDIKTTVSPHQADLIVYDEYNGSTLYQDTEIVFFANYTNLTNDAHLPGATCNISFDDGTTAIMNEASDQYNYTKTDGFSTTGVHSWSVTCNKTYYEEQTSSGTITVSSPDTGTDATGNVGGSSSSSSCVEDWNCTEWGECQSDWLMYRNCYDMDACGTNSTMPNTTKYCKYFKLMDLYWEQLKGEGQNLNIGEMMRVRVFFEDNTYHIADVYEIKGDKVIIDVASRLQRTEYEEGVIKQFDIDDDGILDFEISVLHIYGEHATINIRYLGMTEEEAAKEAQEEGRLVYARYKKERGSWVGMAFGNLMKSDAFTWIFYTLVLGVGVYFVWKKRIHKK